MKLIDYVVHQCIVVIFLKIHVYQNLSLIIYFLHYHRSCQFFLDRWLEENQLNVKTVCHCLKHLHWHSLSHISQLLLQSQIQWIIFFYDAGFSSDTQIIIEIILNVILLLQNIFNSVMHSSFNLWIVILVMIICHKESSSETIFIIVHCKLLKKTDLIEFNFILLFNVWIQHWIFSRCVEILCLMLRMCNVESIHSHTQKIKSVIKSHDHMNAMTEWDYSKMLESFVFLIIFLCWCMSTKFSRRIVVTRTAKLYI